MAARPNDEGAMEGQRSASMPPALRPLYAAEEGLMPPRRGSVTINTTDHTSPSAQRALRDRWGRCIGTVMAVAPALSITLDAGEDWTGLSYWRLYGTGYWFSTPATRALAYDQNVS